MAIDPRKVLPTKINLIRLRRELKMIRKIRDVMEEKREVLLHYIRSAAEEYNKYQADVYKALDRVYLDYYVGAAQMGLEAAEQAAEHVPESLEVEVGTRVIFAVKSPTFRVAEGTLGRGVIPPGVAPPYYSAVIQLRDLMPRILKMAELEEMLRRLIEELRETQRMINALDYVIIPSYQAAIKFIKMVLDERMREDFIRLKMLKKKLEERAAAPQVQVTAAASPQ